MAIQFRFSEEMEREAEWKPHSIWRLLRSPNSTGIVPASWLLPRNLAIISQAEKTQSKSNQGILCSHIQTDERHLNLSFVKLTSLLWLNGSHSCCKEVRFPKLLGMLPVKKLELKSLQTKEKAWCMLWLTHQCEGWSEKPTEWSRMKCFQSQEESSL